MSSCLHLNGRKAYECLVGFRDGLPVFDHHGLSIDFSKDDIIGEGGVDNHIGDVSVGDIGIGDMMKHGGFASVSDLAFTRMAVALFHEYGHYYQNYGPDEYFEEMISEASIVGNRLYYKKDWNEMPHEIEAERIGVKLCWDVFESAFPGKADACMLEYINWRSRETMYMLPAKEGGYELREEVESVFKDARARSLDEPRKLLGGFLGYNIESVALVMQGYHVYTMSPNAYHAEKLISRVPGSEKDKMMCSLVAQLHPDVFDDWPVLRTVDIDVGHIFGRPLAVTTLPDSFVKTVDAVEAIERHSRDISDLERAADDIENSGCDDYMLDGGFDV